MAAGSGGSCFLLLGLSWLGLAWMSEVSEERFTRGKLECWSNLGKGFPSMTGRGRCWTISESKGWYVPLLLGEYCCRRGMNDSLEGDGAWFASRSEGRCLDRGVVL